MKNKKIKNVKQEEINMVVKVQENNIIYKVYFERSQGFLYLHIHDPKYCFGLLPADVYFEAGVNLAYSIDKSPYVKIDMHSQDYYVQLATYTVDMYLKEKEKKEKQKLTSKRKKD